MDVAVYPFDHSEALARALIAAQVTAIAIDDLEAAALEAAGEWAALVVELGDEPLRRLRHIERLVADTGLPVIVVVEPDQVALTKTTAVRDFVRTPIDAEELTVRLVRLQTSAGEDVLRFKDLELNPATYQAALSRSPIDLTYMEYELLRFFVLNQGRVWSREQLLAKVWGYDYFGGARTVDVHVRRLRAKLGEERSSWITTVRSVGYRFG